MQLLLTGGAGSVGVEFLRRAYATNAFDAARVVIRADSPAEHERRWEAHKMFELFLSGRTHGIEWIDEAGWDQLRVETRLGPEATPAPPCSSARIIDARVGCNRGRA